METKNIFLHWLNDLDVPLTSSFTEEIYQKHPYKHTLYGLSKLLTLYKIDNECVRLEDKSTIHELPPPFLANLADDFVIVKSIDHGKISYEWYGICSGATKVLIWYCNGKTTRVSGITT